jgi:hypothetical protein
MPVPLSEIRELLLPGLLGIMERDCARYSLMRAQWGAAFEPLPLPPVPLPVAVAMGAAAVVIKNPVVSRRFLP